MNMQEWNQLIDIEKADQETGNIRKKFEKYGMEKPELRKSSVKITHFLKKYRPDIFSKADQWRDAIYDADWLISEIIDYGKKTHEIDKQAIQHAQIYKSILNNLPLILGCKNGSIYGSIYKCDIPTRVELLLKFSPPSQYRVPWDIRQLSNIDTTNNRAGNLATAFYDVKWKSRKEIKSIDDPFADPYEIHSNGKKSKRETMYRMECWNQCRGKLFLIADDMRNAVNGYDDNDLYNHLNRIVKLVCILPSLTF